jgi:hypothetical protein
MTAGPLFAGVATASLGVSQPWYEELIGRPADVIVNDEEVMWRMCDGGWLYLVEDPDRSGRALVALAVPDLDQWIAAMSERGIERPQIETVPGSGRKAPFVDPEGNTVTFIEVIPTDA